MMNTVLSLRRGRYVSSATNIKSLSFTTPASFFITIKAFVVDVEKTVTM